MSRTINRKLTITLDPSTIDFVTHFLEKIMPAITEKLDAIVTAQEATAVKIAELTAKVADAPTSEDLAKLDAILAKEQSFATA